MEVTVALSLLSIVMIGILTLAINTIGYSISAKARTQATILAQQGIEVARKVVSPASGCNPVGSIDYSDKYYKVDGINKDNLLEIPSANDGFVAVDSFGGLERSIYIRDANAGEVTQDSTNYYYVLSKVRWDFAGSRIGEAQIYGLVSK